MGYLDDFLSRVNVTGNTIKDSQFHSTSKFIESKFADSPFYRVVKVNGVDLEVQLQDISSVTRSANVSLVQNTLKFMLLLPNTSVSIGDMVEITDEQSQKKVTWMVTDFISDNNLFPKAKIEKCNYTLQVKTSESKTLLGYDSLNRPEYQTVPNFTDVQCILRNTVSNISLNQEINLPIGQVNITVPYNDITRLIQENDNFNLYNKQFKVIGFNFTNIVNNVGCLIIVAERVVNK